MVVISILGSLKKLIRDVKTLKIAPLNDQRFIYEKDPATGIELFRQKGIKLNIHAKEIMIILLQNFLIKNGIAITIGRNFTNMDKIMHPIERGLNFL